MAARKRRVGGAEKPEYVRIYKRKPRSGPKRGVNLVLTAEHALRLELLAVRGLTTRSEIVMDWIDQSLSRGRKGPPADQDDGPAAEAAV